MKYNNVKLQPALTQIKDSGYDKLRHIPPNTAIYPDPNYLTLLHKNDFTIKHLQSKAYGQTYHSWLRLYAIRVSKNLYVVSGGAIKLTKAMKGIPHLEDELKKLIATQEYLKEIGLFDEDDYEFIEILSHDKR